MVNRTSKKINNGLEEVNQKAICYRDIPEVGLEKDD